MKLHNRKTKAERWLKKRVEDSKKFADYYHFDDDKRTKQQQEMGEYFRSVTAKFSDKEMDQAMRLALFIGDKTELKQGITYDEAGLRCHVAQYIKRNGRRR